MASAMVISCIHRIAERMIRFKKKIKGIIRIEKTKRIGHQANSFKLLAVSPTNK
jgi:hypothetical protein